MPTPDDLAERARRYDRSGMAAVIARLPDQIEFALTSPLPRLPASDRSFSKVVVLGMGGSALPTDVLNDAFAERLALGTVRAWRRYDPPPLDDRTLVVASSFSGNTEETVSALEQLPRTTPVIVLTTGGRLEQAAAGRGCPVVRIPRQREPADFQPRSATGYFVTYLARILHGAGLLDDPATAMGGLPAFLRTSTTIRAQAEEMAGWLGARIAVIYVDARHESSIGRVTKIKINENAKRPAFYSSIPESNHNELVGFSGAVGGRFGLLYLRDPASDVRVHRRFGVMRRIFSGFDHVALAEWEIPGATNLQRVFAALLFADWCSYALALLGGVDPTPVDLVERFKRALEDP
jgi:glucose/mannose-6-phosphate isomerase